MKEAAASITSPAPYAFSIPDPVGKQAAPGASEDEDSEDGSKGRSMIKMRGTYGLSMGFAPDDFLWKMANGDWQERNFRYAFHDLDVDVYDPRIYDRYELELETDTDTPWNAYADIVIDPWSFVGVGHERVTNGWGDIVDVKYKMWQNTGWTINESYRTLLGNVVNIPEIKIVGNQVGQTTLQPQILFMPFAEPNFIASPGRTVDIDYIFRPVRKLWVEYRESPFYLKVFPIAYQDEALTSDDPLHLSNNHIYWAPSPWLWRFDPGMKLSSTPSAGYPQGLTMTQAMWNWDEVWFTENSNRQYLTFLRGMSAGWAVEDFASVDFTVASPMGLWDYYETVTSVPMALRAKMNPTSKLTIGSTYTAKYGIAKQQCRANNQVIAGDATYQLFDKTKVYGEWAGSTMNIEQTNDQRIYSIGSGFKVGVDSRHDFDTSNAIKWDADMAYMSQNFSPGLADYRDTREDRDWGRHIWFEPLSDADQNCRIGDSIDINRYVIGANARAKIKDNLFDVYLNFRNAHEAYTNKFIENVTRGEVTYNPWKNVQFKGLALFRNYHDSVGGLDPLIRERYFDEFLWNNVVQDGLDVNVMTLSAGGKVDLFNKKVSVYGIYEATNDPQDFPREILNTPQVRGAPVTVDNVNVNRLAYLLYDQNLFNLPPYSGWFNMWKGCVTFTPVKEVQIKYTHVTNTNQNYAPLFDNNHNHDEVALTYSPTKDVRWTTGYSYSQVINLQRAVDTANDPTGRTIDRSFEPHHNVYSRLEWDFKKDQRLTFQFGEKWFMETENSVFSPLWYQDDVSVLDTRPIFRIWYEGKF